MSKMTRTDKIREKYQYLLDAGIDTQTAYRMRHWGWKRINNYLSDVKQYDYDNLGSIITNESIEPYHKVVNHLYESHDVDPEKYKLSIQAKLTFKPKGENNNVKN